RVRQVWAMTFEHVSGAAVKLWAHVRSHDPVVDFEWCALTKDRGEFYAPVDIVVEDAMQVCVPPRTKTATSGPAPDGLTGLQRIQWARDQMESGYVSDAKVSREVRIEPACIAGPFTFRVAPRDIPSDADGDGDGVTGSTLNELFAD